MDDYVVRGVYIVFAIAGAGVMFARGLAYWLEWMPWSVRGVGLAAALLGVGGVFNVFGAGIGIKALLIVGAICAIYVWQDVGLEKRDNEERERKHEEMMKKL